MAKIDWTFVDEVGTNLNRYIATDGDSGVTYDLFLMRNAEISQVGTSLNASNLNQLISSINTLYDKTSTIDTSINTINNNITNINSNITTINNKFSSYVPITRTINGKELSSNISITKSDVGLGNVDNTKDSAKIVAQANQLTTPRYFKISDYNNTNSTSSYSFNGTSDVNIVLPKNLYLNNLYIANASNDEEYALFRYSNSNKRLEVKSLGDIIFISGSHYANVPNNKSGTLVLDWELQEVKDRLDQMGFSEGTFEVSGVSSEYITTNKIVKKGKYAIGNLSIILYDGALRNLSIMLPREFKPLNSTQVMLGYANTLSSFFMTTTMQEGIDLTEFKKLKNVVSLSIVNIGWEIE